jgi:hypothetical protein
MPVLLEVQSENDKVRTITKSIIDSSTPFGHKITKSTDSELPEGFKWRDGNGELLKGVWVDDDPESDVLYVRTVTEIVTLADVQASKIAEFERLKDSEIKAIEPRDDLDRHTEAIIVNKFVDKVAEIGEVATIQEAELVSWK